MPIQCHDLSDHIAPEPPYRDSVFDEMTEQHYVVLGRFLAMCASIEEALHRGLRFLSGVDEPMARLLIGQPRVEDLIQSISKIIQLRNWEDAELVHLTKIRAHLRYVYGVRNIVAHQRPFWKDDWIKFDRFHTARDIRRPTDLIYVVKVEELQNLTASCHPMIGSLSQLIVGGPPTRQITQIVLDDLEAFVETHPMPPNPR
jgi:hypothetical protein